MTAVTPDIMVEGSMLRVLSFGRVQSRLHDLLADHRGQAAWWVELARQLDDLAETVAEAPGDLVDVEGFAEQIRSDAPHLMGRWLKLSGERERLYHDVTEVRILTGQYAGDRTAVGAVSRAVRDVLARVRRFQERTTEVLLDAYERDMGGE